jgi:hypothetical protein
MDNLLFLNHTWRDHNLMFFRAYSQESQIVLRINIAHDTSRLGGQLLQQASVLCGRRVV